VSSNIPNEQRAPIAGEYVNVGYTGGFSRSGDVTTVDHERRRAYVQFHYSNIPSEWIEWNRLSYNKTALRESQGG
jgi:hypothetical protein